MGLMAMLVGHGPNVNGVPQYRGAIDGGKYWWVAPTLNQMRSSEIWTDLKRACRFAARPKFGGKILEVEKEIRLETGALIAVKSADSGVSLRGSGLSGLVVDEFPFLNERLWLEELRPSLSDTGGWSMLIGTPKGRNFAHKIFAEVQSGNRPDWETWQLPTRLNPLIPQSELDAARRDLGPRRYAQEYEAKFTDIENATFPGHYFDNIWVNRWPDAFQVTSMYLDPSLGKESKVHDDQAIVFAGVAGTEIFTEAWIVKLPPMELVGLFVTLFYQLRPTYAGIEANGFQSLLAPLILAYCREHGLAPVPIIPIVNTVKKVVRIAALDAWLAPVEGTGVGRLRIKRTASGEKLVDQLQMFPDKDTHDDGPDALEGAIRLFYRGAEVAEQEAEDNGPDEVVYVE